MAWTAELNQRNVGKAPVRGALNQAKFVPDFGLWTSSCPFLSEALSIKGFSPSKKRCCKRVYRLETKMFWLFHPCLIKKLLILFKKMLLTLSVSIIFYIYESLREHVQKNVLILNRISFVDVWNYIFSAEEKRISDRGTIRQPTKKTTTAKIQSLPWVCIHYILHAQWINSLLHY